MKKIILISLMLFVLCNNVLAFQDVKVCDNIICDLHYQDTNKQNSKHIIKPNERYFNPMFSNYNLQNNLEVSINDLVAPYRTVIAHRLIKQFQPQKYKFQLQFYYQRGN